MKNLSEVLQGEPEVIDDECGYALRWSEDLFVIILSDGRIGQFAASERWRRSEIEAALEQRIEKMGLGFHGSRPERIRC